MRYFFILHNTKVEEFGKEKMKKIFMSMFISIPFLILLLDSFEEFHLFSYINKCYGKDHAVFLIETSTLNVLKHKFWSFESHENGQNYEVLFYSAKQICKIIKHFFLVIMGSNISEAVIYYKVLTHMNR